MANQKKKGKRVEREIARLLTEATGDNWNRVLSSGGYATTSGTKEGRFKGDVFSDEWENYCIEVKSTKKTIDLPKLFSDKSLFAKYINQLIRECGEDTPILFIKINRRGTYVIYEPGFERSKTLVQNLKLEKIKLDLYPDHNNKDDKWEIRKLK